jgi:SAM-dependent methyltransferase
MKTNVGDHDEVIYDFMIHHPSYCQSEVEKQWLETQEEFENTLDPESGETSLGKYLEEIDSVKEIYTEEFHIRGDVLDVGGHQGRVRHFFKDDEVPLYVSVDPYLDAFAHIGRQPNLLKAYPCLSKPCNFLASHAERLPFKSGTFDWVQMRSVVDHFSDPFLAFKEAYRVLRPAGYLMIGLAIVERITREHSRKERNLVQRAVKKLKRGKEYSFKTDSKVFGGAHDDHIFRFTYQELLDLLSVTGFQVKKEHWQKPPYSFSIYLTARKKKLS